MKYQELTIQQIPRAIMRHWKLVLMSTALFLVIGICVAIVFSPMASAEGTGTAETFQLEAFNPEKIELTYYNDFYSYLVTQQSYLYTYLDAVRLDSTMKAEQVVELEDFLKEINQYNEENLKEIISKLNKPHSLYVPDTLRKEAIDEYSILLENTQQEMIRSEHANQMIQAIGGLSTADTAINETYATLLNVAAQYGQLQLNLNQYEEKLDMLNHQYTEVQKESKNLENMLLNAQETLQILVDNGNTLLAKIANENHINLTINPTEENLEVFIDHTNRMATKEEAFAAFVVLFGMIGICAGCYIALCREYHFLDKQSEKTTKGN
ncbi:hypothetical protein ACTQ33_08830 [Candidatus Avoscillospira sp. LCP25S3_F1]|uniref:hypothetical protein n=1 Tax=Candidatus Avoscillospira sp. LCP25S3_F1 TaxID=3438825 RepID=UPI003F8DAB3C